MHLGFPHLLPDLFLNHTLWHDGGVGSRWKHQQGLQQAGEEQAIQSEQCLARACDKRWTNDHMGEENKKPRPALHWMQEKNHRLWCFVFLSTLYHSKSSSVFLHSWFLTACRCVCMLIDLHMSMCTKAIICRMSQDRQSVSSPVCQLHSNAGWQHPKCISIWQWSLWNQALVQPRLSEEQWLHHHTCIQS